MGEIQELLWRDRVERKLDELLEDGDISRMYETVGKVAHCMGKPIPHWHSDDDPYVGRNVLCPVGEVDGVKQYTECKVMYYDSMLGGYRCYPEHPYRMYDKRTGRMETRQNGVDGTFYLMTLEQVRRQLGE